MANSVPWSIKGVDKKTREKMKQLAFDRGITLADLLNEMLNNVGSQLVTKDIPEIAHQMQVQVASTKPERLEKSVAAQSAQDDSVVMVQETPVQEPVKVKENLSEKTSQIFNNLVQKIGGDTPVIAKELSDNDMTETIMRERHMRDLVRVQMTEMREVIAVNLEKRIDDKMSQFMSEMLQNFTIPAAGTVATDQPVMPAIDTQNLVKKSDLDAALSRFSEVIQLKTVNSIQSELRIFSDAIEKIIDAMSAEIVQMSTLLEQKNVNLQSYLQNLPEDIAGNDVAVLALLQENTDIMSNRMQDIEKLCAQVNKKLSSDFSLGEQSEDTAKFVKSLQTISGRLVHLENLVKSLGRNYQNSHDDAFDLDDEVTDNISPNLGLDLSLAAPHDNVQNHEEALDFGAFPDDFDNDDPHLELAYDPNSEGELGTLQGDEIRHRDQSSLIKSMRSGINKKLDTRFEQEEAEAQGKEAKVNHIRNMVFIGGISIVAILTLYIFL